MSMARAVAVAPSRWIAADLEAEGAGPVALVRPAVDKDVFSVAAVAVRASGPLRVLVQGEAREEALAAVGAMREEHTVAVVAGEPAERAAAYAQAHVVVDLSRSAGAPDATLEAFHCGATAVATLAPGREDFLDDGVNAIVANWEDRRGCQRALDLLARDPRLLHLLRVNALATARGWPGARQSAAMLALATARAGVTA
jgi:glycosyltransferase involved in cell wall biosynthesis